MNVLLIGGGGREHALAWKLAQSPLLTALYCAPGNPGIAEVARCIALDPLDFPAVTAFCRQEAIGLVVVGPEHPLVAGLADALNAAGVRCFGPSAAAARLEGSKGFTKDLCARAGIPTAAFARCATYDEAAAAIDRFGAPVVVKADGIAAGKGVVIAQTVADAKAAAQEMFGGRFGAAGAELVVEEYMTGEEASFFALVDGARAMLLAAAQDHKRVGDGDTGPNTGGMGAYSPTPVLTPSLAAEVMRSIITPTVAALAADGTPYVGVLFAGLMLTADGPKLIEYNCRFGDPECQVLMLRLQSDLLPALIAACDGALDGVALAWRDLVAMTVVMAAQGYPDAPAKGSVIHGLERAAQVDGVTLFHAGTRRQDDALVADGGRVLNVCATADTVAEARARAYAAIDRIDWPQGFCRRDIGWRGLREGV